MNEVREALPRARHDGGDHGPHRHRIEVGPDTADSGKEYRLKLIIAFIQPYKVEEVRDALRAAGVTGMSITNVQGFGRQSGQTETYRGNEYTVDFVPKIMLQIFVDDAVASAAVEAIEHTARTGTIGDGKIAVLPIEDVIRIRTGERGAGAL